MDLKYGTDLNFKLNFLRNIHFPKYSRKSIKNHAFFVLGIRVVFINEPFIELEPRIFDLWLKFKKLQKRQ